MLEHVADFFLIHPVNRFLGNSEGHQALAMISLTSTLGCTALARAGELRLHELSLRAHVGIRVRVGNRCCAGAAGNRVSGRSGQPQLWGGACACHEARMRQDQEFMSEEPGTEPFCRVFERSIRVAVPAVLFTVGLAGADTLPRLEGRQPPQSVEELWVNYDPDAEPLEVEVIREFEEEGITIRMFTYAIGSFRGRKSRMAGYYGFPTGTKAKLPALIQMHGGGQRAEVHSIRYAAQNGYACLALNWGGRTLERAREGDPGTDWGAVDATQTGHNSHYGSLIPDDRTVDTVESPRNSNWFLIVMAAFAGFYFNNVYLCLLAMFLLGTQSAFFGPAKYGVIPELVDTSKISMANGIINMLTNVAVIAATLVAGVIYEAYRGPEEVAVPEGLIWLPGVALLAVAVVGLIAALQMPKLKASAENLKVKWEFFAPHLRTIRRMREGDSPIFTVCLLKSGFGMLAFMFLLILMKLQLFYHLIHQIISPKDIHIGL